MLSMSVMLAVCNQELKMFPARHEVSLRGDNSIFYILLILMGGLKVISSVEKGAGYMDQGNELWLYRRGRMYEGF